MKRRLVSRLICILFGLAWLAGCRPSPDERIAQLTQQSLDTQARQNDRLVQQNQLVIEASKELVAKDAEARAEMVDLQHDLQLDQREVGRQRDTLEQERRQLAGERYQEQLVSSAITTVGLLLIAALPLVVALYMLRAVHATESSDAVLAEVLVDEILTDQPRLLARPVPPSLESPRPTSSPPAVNVAAHDPHRPD